MIWKAENEETNRTGAKTAAIELLNNFICSLTSPDRHRDIPNFAAATQFNPVWMDQRDLDDILDDNAHPFYHIEHIPLTKTSDYKGIKI
ncbi:hypothetical protein AVEN_176261-1 [Araneus ventricosus]|uniref:Uncharacterized protein n=1 Tax=Araneus ventricosus TaxID=182803 RepID=A0A4Y2U0A2_ARAVE|nr:hypothetical protein AVEN_176261-1 [Araneus ventricosus]